MLDLRTTRTKKIINKITASFVILKSKPPKYKENRGKISNCSNGLKKNVFNIIHHRFN